MVLIHVKRPRLLGSDLKEIAALHPLGLQLSLQTPGVSTATLTLSPDDAEPGMHDWIELYNQNGSVGVYRVTNPVTDFNQQLTLTLRHGIDCLADAVLEAQEDYKGAPQALLTRLLNAQKTLVNGVKPWVLGTCAATDDIDVNINYPRLSELLNTIEGQLEGYLITYDQTVFPWVLSVIEKPSTVDAEFRLNRNVQTLSRTLNDNEMCTQLILSINSKTVKAGVTGTDTIIKTYDNAEAQQRWGIIQKTADIDTSDTLTGDNVTTPEADAWAARFLRDHAAPAVQMQITGYELSRITGDTWDETKLGHICRVAVPKYNQSFDERIVAITYPDALGQPDSVTVSLANQLPKFSSAIASLKKEAARAGGAARKAGRDKADADEMQTWSQTVQYYGLALDGTGVLTLYESGIDMNPVGGVTIYSLEEGLQALYGGIQVNSHAITLKVSKGEVGTQLAVECGNVHISGTPGSANLIVDGYVEADQIFSASAQHSDIYAIDIDASGTIYCEDLETSGTGTITTAAIEAYSLTLSGNPITECVVDASVSGNVLTLTKDDGTTVTFSKATSLSGAWSGTTYTVTATPQNVTLVTALGMQIPANTSSGTATIKLVEIDQEDPTQTTDRFTRSLYLKADNDYCYITTADATPTASNTVAKITNPKTGGEITDMTLATSSSGASSDYSYSGRLAYDTYYLITAKTADDTKTFKFRTCSVSSRFSSTSTVPGTVTPTQIHVGDIYRLTVTVNGTNIRNSYYVCVP